jgi:3-oxoacyl-[acyl-carrier protein] reductase
MSLNGKTALVTGGTRGIGRAICLELARRGAKVVVNYPTDTENADETVKLITDFGGVATAVKGDVSDYKSCEEMLQNIPAEFGMPDILVNNAGITRDNLLLMMKPEDFGKVIDVNLLGVFNVTKLVMRNMIKKKYGRIVNIASVVGITGNAGQSNYSASKAGVIGFTKSIAKEVASRGITCNAIAPGFIETDMTAALSPEQKEKIFAGIPAGRGGSPEDVAHLAGFFCDEGSEYITGQVVAVDGGMA